jgi:hypothetical protein
MRVDDLDLPSLYARANAGFQEAIEQNPSLSIDELGMPWSNIVPKDAGVCVRDSGLSRETFVIETKLDLLAPDGTCIGWYSLHEDEDANPIDDFLVFE